MGRFVFLALLLCLGLARSLRQEIEDEQEVLDAVTGCGSCPAASTCKNNVCTCNTGYEMVNNVCKAINPCLTNNGGCSANAVCSMTTPGQRLCSCKAGYSDPKITDPNLTNRGLTCNLIPCSTGSCGLNQVCVQKTNEPFTCVCAPDYLPVAGYRQLQCGFNPCQYRNVTCGGKGRCAQLYGQNPPYQCYCQQGYIHPRKADGTEDATQCIKDWCAAGVNPCGPHSKCSTDGTKAVCTCDEFYGPVSETKCEYVDPCKTNNGGCPAHSQCRNLGSGGRVACPCDAGYKLNGNTCELIRCSAKPCGQDQICKQDGDKPYTCECAPDFVPDRNYKSGLRCVKDICTYRKIVCENGVCRNQWYGDDYDCICNAGFANVPKTKACVKDVCATNKGGCPAHSTCKLTLTGRDCVCDKDYEMVNGKCEVIDLCKTKNAGCSPNAVCSMVGPGVRKCTCKPGYNDALANQYDESKKGTICDLIRCSPSTCGSGQVCTQKPDQPYVCSCAPDYVPRPNYPYLYCDYNPCKYRNVTCGGNGECELVYRQYGVPRQPGELDYSCRCKPGYLYPRKADGSYDSTTCVKDWCAKGVNPCGPNSKCSSDGTKAICSCDEFYAPVSPTKCEYIDPCKTNNGGCPKHATCQNKGWGGRVECFCQPGFQTIMKDGVPFCQPPSCNNNICPYDSTCKDNGDDLPTCTCKPYADTVKTNYFPFVKCDYNPCKTNQCGQGSCIPDAQRKAPYYSCNCNKGLVFDGKTCVVDVCYGYTKCGDTADCVVKGGKPTCECKKGYERDAKGVCVLATCKNKAFNKCDPVNGICTPLDAQSVKCDCKPGYRDPNGAYAAAYGQIPNAKCAPVQCSDAYKSRQFAAPCPPTYDCKDNGPKQPRTCVCPLSQFDGQFEEADVVVGRDTVKRCFPADPCKGRKPEDCGALNRVCTKSYMCLPRGTTETCTLSYFCKCKEGYYSFGRTVTTWTARDIIQQGAFVTGDGCFIGDSCKYNPQGVKIADENGGCPAGKKCVMRGLGGGHICCPGASPWC